MMMTHFTCGAMREWPEFVELAGRIWFGDVCPPDRGQHDPFRTFEVVIADREHPITKTMENFEVPDELYTCLTGETPIHVIATARSSRDGKDYPMAFVLEIGKGRVFQTVLGHDTRCYETPGVQTLMQRACLWTAGREP